MCIRDSLIALFHHAGGDDDAPPGEAGKHIERFLRTGGVGIKGVVNDGHNPGNELQAMLDGLDYAHAAGNFFH